MSKYIIKIKDKYLMWSTIVDAPVTYGLTRKELAEYYKEEYGNQGLSSLPDRLNRVDKYGTSSIPNMTVAMLVDNNRAGENESKISVEEVYKKYCIQGE